MRELQHNRPVKQQVEMRRNGPALRPQHGQSTRTHTSHEQGQLQNARWAQQFAI